MRISKLVFLMFYSVTLGTSSIAQAGLFDGVIAGALKGAVGGEKSNANNAPPGVVTITEVNSNSLPATKKVILGNFVVEFQSRYEKTSQGLSFMGMGNAGSSTAINDVTLPNSQTLQTITNFAYLDVVKMLKAKGYEVIQVTGLSPEAKAAYQEMAQSPSAIKQGEQIENYDGTSVLYSPDGMTSMLPAQGCEHYRGSFNMSRNVSLARTPARENALASAQGGIPILKVWMTVGFGEVAAQGGNANENILKRQQTYTSTTASIESGNNAQATAGMYLKPGATRFSFLIPDDNKFEYKAPGCQSGFRNKNTYRDPADGDAILLLGNKYQDDGSEVLALSSRANSIGVTDSSIGGGVGIRSVKENSDGTPVQTARDERGAKLSMQGTHSSGTIVGNAGIGTRIDTTTQYATEIRADYYATTAVKLIDDVSRSFIDKLH